ncbi:MAG: hypothetical protein MOB07_18465 [Acidobacteria bacterium]|nr:hypothetical protein [Acidobacteriota bacterium]
MTAKPMRMLWRCCAFAFLLTLAVWMLTFSGSPDASAQDFTTALAQEPENKSKVKAVQLDPIDGVLPVQLELIPETGLAQALTNANASLGDSSPKIHFKVKNSSAKSIDAYQVSIHVITLTDDGKERMISPVDVGQDFAPHPDIRDYDQLRPIPPGADVTVGPRGLKFEDRKKIQTVVLKMDFVIYDDGTFVSSVKDGAEAILSRRRGAEMYKKWAMKFYNENNKSADVLYERVLEFKPYKDMVFESKGDIRAYETAGANVYRAFLIRLYNKDRSAIDQYLKEVK